VDGDASRRDASSSLTFPVAETGTIPLAAVRFDLAGHVRLVVPDPDPGVARVIASTMRPFEPDAAGAADVEVVRSGQPPRLVEFQHAARDDVTTATDGRRVYYVWRGTTCSIPNAMDERPAVFEYEAGFPLWRVVRPALRPALQLAATARGSAAVHAASVVVDDRAVLVGGWSETGKTETALALCEAGAGFLSDKWTFAAADRTASTFPITVGVRSWVLEYLPKLRRVVPRRDRAQFALAGVASAAAEPVRKMRAATRPFGLVADVVERAAALGQRVAFEVDEIDAAYGRRSARNARVPIRLLAMLASAPPGAGVTVEEADPGRVAARLARAAAFERRAYFELLQRGAYAVPEWPATFVDRAVALDEGAMARALEGVRTVIVRAPFPTDPRPVADAILGALP
jgi:hypothetical protein